MQGLALFEKAELVSEDKGKRLLKLAVERFRAAIRIKPIFPEAYKSLGRTLGDLKEFQAAVDAYDRVLALNPNDFENWADRAAPLINQNKTDEAVDSATNAVQHAATSHSFAYALATRAAAYHFGGQRNEAVTDLISAWKIHHATIVESIRLHGLYERICVAEPSAEAVLLIAELRWTIASHHAGKNDTNEANRWIELGAQALESRTGEPSDNLLWSGFLSNQLIDEVLIRIAARFHENSELQRTIVRRMQDWVKKTRGEELPDLNSELSNS